MFEWIEGTDGTPQSAAFALAGFGVVLGLMVHITVLPVGFAYHKLKTFLSQG